jgi:predicted nucleic acid-binding protein
MTKYYIDTCIWRDYFENREDKLRPLGEWAFRLIQKIVEEEDVIIISSLVKEELLKGYSEKKLMGLLSLVPEKITLTIAPNKHHDRLAESLMRESGLPFTDALHAILAKENDAILVTRDKHFSLLAQEFKISKPEELI